MFVLDQRLLNQSMSENEEHAEYTADIEPSAAARKRLRDRSKVRVTFKSFFFFFI
jgi:hypothetical protein